MESHFLGFELNALKNNEDVIMSVFLLVFVLALVISLYVQHILESYPKLKFIPEVGATILVGIAMKCLLWLIGTINNTNEEGFSTNSIGFSSKLFFLGFLPPIIFNSGYHLNRRLFYANFFGIICLAVFGTIISTIITSFGLSLMFQKLGIKFSFMEVLLLLLFFLPIFITIIIKIIIKSAYLLQL